MRYLYAFVYVGSVHRSQKISAHRYPLKDPAMRERLDPDIRAGIRSFATLNQEIPGILYLSV